MNNEADQMIEEVSTLMDDLQDATISQRQAESLLIEKDRQLEELRSEFSEYREITYRKIQTQEYEILDLRADIKDLESVPLHRIAGQANDFKIAVRDDVKQLRRMHFEMGQRIQRLDTRLDGSLFLL